MDFKDKAESLAKRMNKLTESLDLSDDLIVHGDDIIDLVQEKTKDISLYKQNDLSTDEYEFSYADIMNLEVMTEDFRFVRDTLKEVTENARRVQNSVTLELIDSDGEQRASLIAAFSELSKAITDAQKLYVQSYKEMSTTLLNLDKIKKAEPPKTVNNTTNNLNISTSENISTADLIQRLRTFNK